MSASSKAVTIVHEFGERKELAETHVDAKRKQVSVLWPACGAVTFNFVTGCVIGEPRSLWRLSMDDRVRYCAQFNLLPKDKALRALKRASSSKMKIDPRQMSLVEEELRVRTGRMGA